jgi:hypothetical protein
LPATGNFISANRDRSFRSEWRNLINYQLNVTKADLELCFEDLLDRLRANAGGAVA